MISPQSLPQSADPDNYKLYDPVRGNWRRDQSSQQEDLNPWTGARNGTGTWDALLGPDGYAFDPRYSSLPVKGVTSSKIPCGMCYDYLPRGTPIMAPVPAYNDGAGFAPPPPLQQQLYGGLAAFQAGGLGASPFQQQGAFPGANEGTGQQGAMAEEYSAGQTGVNGPMGGSGTAIGGGLGASGGGGQGGFQYASAGLWSGLQAGANLGRQAGANGGGMSGFGEGIGGGPMAGQGQWNGRPGGMNFNSKRLPALQEGETVRICNMTGEDSLMYNGLIGDVVSVSHPHERREPANGPLFYVVRCILLEKESLKSHEQFESQRPSQKALKAAPYNRQAVGQYYSDLNLQYQESRNPNRMPPFLVIMVSRDKLVSSGTIG